MLKAFFFTVFLIMTLVFAGFSHATVITFEDLYTNTYQVIPNGYFGFNWDSPTQIGVVNGPLHQSGSGYDYGSVSGDMVAFNYNGLTPSDISLIGTGTFDFNGAYFTSAWYNQTISFEGYNNGSLLYTSVSYFIDTTTPTWIELNWSGIDTLRISSTNMQWAMDNFTFNEHNEHHEAPEPSTLLLFGTGLIGIGAYGWRRMKK